MFSNKNLIIAGLSYCLLSIWLILATALLANMEKGNLVYIGWALIGLVVVMSILAPINGAAVMAIIMAVIAFFCAEVAYANSLGVPVFGAVRAPILLSGTLVMVVTGFLGDIVSKRMRVVQGQLSENSSLIEALTIKDSLTGTFKRYYADRLLGQEIERSRRFGHCVSLIDLSIDDWEAFTKGKAKDESDQVLVAASRVLMASLRNMDSVSHLGSCRFIVILPETPLEGAHIAAERLCREVAAEATISLRAGIAEFPSDAVSKAELMSEAYSAQQFAKNSGISVASRSLLT